MFTSFDLKLIAVLTMIIDHMGFFFVPILPTEVYELMRYIGRVAYPIFIYVMVEGFVYTSSKRRYLLRLVLAGVIMHIGSFLLSLYVQNVLNPDFFFPVELNIFFSLANGFLFLFAIDLLRHHWQLLKMVLSTSLILVTIFLSQFVEFSIHTLILSFGLYMFRKDKWMVSVFYLLYWIGGILTQIYLLPNEYTWKQESQWFMIASLPLILLHNKKRGPSFKYLFYAIYPFHIWLFYLLGYSLGIY